MSLKSGFFAAWALVLAAYAVFWVLFEMDYRTRAAALYSRGEYARAADLFSRVVERKSGRDRAEALVARGTTQLRLGDAPGAEKDANGALALWPGYAFGLLLRAETSLATGNHARAVEDCEASLKAAPSLPWSYWVRGNIRRESGEVDAAVADYDKALQFMPSVLVMAWDRLGRMRSIQAIHVDRSVARRLKGDLPGAVEDCGKALAYDGRFADALLNRGLALLLQGKREDAQKDFDEFAKLRPAEKPLLAAEIAWAQAGTPPTAAKVLQARGWRPAVPGQPGAGK